MLTKALASINASLKAHAAGLGAAVTLLLADLDAATPGHGVTLHQWIAIVGAYLGVGAAIHIIPNVPKGEDVVDDAVGDLTDVVYAATEGDK